MDTKLAVHAGAEILVVGGIFMYFNKQLKTMTTSIEQLNARMKQLENILKIHDDVLRNMMDRGPPQEHIHTHKKKEEDKKFKQDVLDKELNEELGALANDNDEVIEEILQEE